MLDHLKDQRRPQPEMDQKPKRKRMNMKSHLCIPRLRSNTANTCTTNTKRLSPMSLLERFREAVFRLIMLTAFSKVTQNTGGSVDTQRSYYPPDHYQSEAVAECIEFIKKSASPDENRESSASCSIDDTTEVVIPVPVM